jgi:serine/threonine protein kinase
MLVVTCDDRVGPRFEREAKVLASLRHPGIVDVLDFGREGNAFVMVLEYVHGYHLGLWLKYFRQTSQRFSMVETISL